MGGTTSCVGGAGVVSEPEHKEEPPPRASWKPPPLLRSYSDLSHVSLATRKKRLDSVKESLFRNPKQRASISQFIRRLVPKSTRILVGPLQSQLGGSQTDVPLSSLAISHAHGAELHALTEYRTDTSHVNDLVQNLSAQDAERAYLSNSSVLHQAALEGHSLVIEEILSAGEQPVDRFDDKRRTPLHVACLKDRVLCVSALLKWGANVHRTDKDGVTPLHLAATGGHMQCINLLLHRGADVCVTDDYGHNVLHQTGRGGHVMAVGRLLAAGAGVGLNALDKDGCTPLDCTLDGNNLKSCYAQTVLCMAQNGAVSFRRGLGARFKSKHLSRRKSITPDDREVVLLHQEGHLTGVLAAPQGKLPETVVDLVSVDETNSNDSVVATNAMGQLTDGALLQSFFRGRRQYKALLARGLVQPAPSTSRTAHSHMRVRSLTSAI